MRSCCSRYLARSRRRVGRGANIRHKGRFGCRRRCLLDPWSSRHFSCSQARRQRRRCRQRQPCRHHHLRLQHQLFRSSLRKSKTRSRNYFGVLWRYKPRRMRQARERKPPEPCASCACSRDSSLSSSNASQEITSANELHQAVRMRKKARHDHRIAARHDHL